MIATIFGLSGGDLAVIAGYFALTIALGFAAMRRIQDQEDYFLGGRRFGKILQIFSAFGQATSSESAVGAVTTTYRDGAGGLWSQLAMLWTTPFYWITSPWYRRMRVLTMGDFFHERYRSRAMAMVYSVVAAFFLVIIVAMGLKAVSATVRGITLKPEAALSVAERAESERADRLRALEQRHALAGLDAETTKELETLRLEQPRREFSAVSEPVLVWIVVLVVFIYTLAGGLEGAVWSEAIQGTLILVLSFMLIPFAIDKLELLHAVEGVGEVGGLLHERLPGYFFSLFGSAQGAQFTWYFVAALAVMNTVNVAVQANQLTATASARDELTASIGFTTGTFIKRYLTVIWGALALLCYALYHDHIRDPDLVWGHATRDLLGPVGYGLVGLMIACLLAAFQSTASTLMISASSLMARNVYAPLVPGRSERHYLLVGRLVGAVFLCAAALMCTAFLSLVEMMKFLWEFNAVVAASFWCGLKWRRATRAGAWSSISVAFVWFIALPVGLPAVFSGLRTAPELLRGTEERALEQYYQASVADVERREREIEAWQGDGSPPSPVQLGERLRRSIVMAPVAIYWSQGIGLDEGVSAGRGMFFLEMWILDQAFDLSRNPYALNETIRYAFKILLPFVVIIVVSLMTRRDDSPEVARFFLRMRTKVRGDRGEDERALDMAYRAPGSTREALLFPRSDLELFKWERSDYIGVGLSFVGVLGVIALLFAILTIGA